MLTITLVSLTAALVAQAAPIPAPAVEKRLGCKKIYHIHARGTAEPGNLGMLVGSPFSTALSLKFPGGVESVGVVYSADVIGAVTGAMMPQSQAGAVKMAQMAKDQMNKCPESKLVLSGYSQGAEQVHGALKNLGVKAAQVGAAVTFGDPMNMALVSFNGGWGSLPSSRAKVFCYAGDPVCGGIGISHLSYSSSAGEAASFVAKVLPSGGLSSSSSSSSSGSSLLSSLSAKGGDSKGSKSNDNKGSSSKGNDKGGKSSSDLADRLKEMLSKADGSKSNDSKGSASKSNDKGGKSSSSSSSELADRLKEMLSKADGSKGKDSAPKGKDSGAKGKDSSAKESDSKGSKGSKGRGKNNAVELDNYEDAPHFVMD